MVNFKQEIAKEIAEVTNLDSKELENYIEIPPNSDLGDYAFPCFKLAKELRKAPPMIANDIKENIKIDEKIIEKIEVVGGYLNIYVNKQTLAKEVLEDVAKNKEKYGSSDIGKGKNVVIDYSAPNIAKPFHIGHLRSTVIGGALYKIYNFLGYNSVGINFLGDWGLQFGKVMAGIKLWKDEYDFKNDEMSSILKTYIRFNKEEKEILKKYASGPKILARVERYDAGIYIKDVKNVVAYDKKEVDENKYVETEKKTNKTNKIRNQILSSVEIDEDEKK